MNATLAQPTPFAGIRATTRRLAAAIAVPAVIFAVTRLGLVLVVYLGLAILPRDWGHGQFWRSNPTNLLLDGWARWDAGFYHDIAVHGYTNLPNVLQQRDVAFFP